MGLATFKGGIHPYEGKELSENKPVQVLEPKGELVYPMSQHIGAPAKPLVAVGDHVLAGQKIGEAGGFISANVIASVSGTVKKDRTEAYGEWRDGAFHYRGERRGVQRDRGSWGRP